MRPIRSGITDWSRRRGAETIDVAVDLAVLPLSIRGYGYVRERHAEEAKKRERVLREALRRPVQAPLSLAA